jgi:hypothetical protein
VVLVRLPDGRVVARTPEELAELPPDERAQLQTLEPPRR